MVVSSMIKLRKYFMFIYRLCLFGVLFLLPVASQATQIKLQVSPNPVQINEAFKLTFTASEKLDGPPDFGPLKQDFDILNQQQGSRSSWVNGKTTQTISWVLNLMAKRSGTVTIPAIEFGQDISAPLSIVVKPQASEGEQAGKLFLRVSASPEIVYLQSQMIYTWQFYRRADVSVGSASLSEPQLDDAIRLPLGENRQFSTKVDGVSYIVTEGRYAIFPQQSGDLRIPPLVLTAEVYESAQNGNSFFRLQSSATRRIRSEAIELEVLSPPEVYNAAQWLPAMQLELTEKWSNDSLQAKVGEPLTRTLTLRATAALKSQLPDIKLDIKDENLSRYADQPVLAEKPFLNGVSSLREQKVALIASQPGQYTLPAIEVPWFNTQSGKMELARLPQRTLTITAAPQANVETSMPPVVPGRGDQKVAPDKTDAAIARGDSGFWPILAAVLGSGWLLTLFILFRMKRSQSGEPLPVSASRQISQAKAELQRACDRNEPKAAQQALLKWCQLHYGAASLSELIAEAPAQLRDELVWLESALYARDTPDWQGAALWQAFARGAPGANTGDSSVGPLKPLYPA